MSKKKTPPAYLQPTLSRLQQGRKKQTHGEFAGPMIVETHSNRFSPLGPAEQLHGGSKLISANSFCILWSKDQY